MAGLQDEIRELQRKSEAYERLREAYNGTGPRLMAIAEGLRNLANDIGHVARTFGIDHRPASGTASHGRHPRVDLGPLYMRAKAGEIITAAQLQKAADDAGATGRNIPLRFKALPGIRVELHHITGSRHRANFYYWQPPGMNRTDAAQRIQNIIIRGHDPTPVGTGIIDMDAREAGQEEDGK